MKRITTFNLEQLNGGVDPGGCIPSPFPPFPPTSPWPFSDIVSAISSCRP